MRQRRIRVRFFNFDQHGESMKVKAFKAWRPAEGKAETVASVPYDVVDTKQAAELAAQMLAYAGRARLETARTDLSKLVSDQAELLRASIE